MIYADFFKKNNDFYGFKITGHSNYSKKGTDIVCAGVSSAVMMTINTITEVLKVDAELFVNKDVIEIYTKDSNLKDELKIIYKGLYLHILLLEKDYNENIKVSIQEVCKRC